MKTLIKHCKWYAGVLFMLTLSIGQAWADAPIPIDTDTITCLSTESNILNSTTIDIWMLRVQFVLVVLTLATVFIAARQLCESNKRNRAEFIISLYNEFVNDNDMLDMFYSLEYGKFNYTPSEFHDSKQEKQLDKLLGHFDNICRLYRMGELKKNDFQFIEYQIRRVANNKDVKNYFTVLDGWTKVIGEKQIKYADLRRFTLK